VFLKKENLDLEIWKKLSGQIIIKIKGQVYSIYDKISRKSINEKLHSLPI